MFFERIRVFVDSRTYVAALAQVLSGVREKEMPPTIPQRAKTLGTNQAFGTRAVIQLDDDQACLVIGFIWKTTTLTAVKTISRLEDEQRKVRTQAHKHWKPC
jgi:hypothetical protein